MVPRDADSADSPDFADSPDVADDSPPSIAALRAHLTATRPTIGTGWPVLDDITEGLQVGDTTVVRGPRELRLQVLTRMAAWAAGEGHPTVVASRSWTTEELWLAVAAGGLGLPARALQHTTAHDEWLDARLRVLDLRVLGGHDAPARTAQALTRRMPTLLVIDDYGDAEAAWDEQLALPSQTRDVIHGADLDFRAFPRSLGCALVLGSGDMDLFSDWLERSTLTIRFVEEPPGHAQLTVWDRSTKVRRTQLLRDGFLEPPVPGAPLRRRPGVVNIWEEAHDREIDAFARTLGASRTELVWEADDQAP